MIFRCLLIVLVFPVLITAQNNIDRELSKSRSQLKVIQDEISRIRRQISKAKSQEITVLSQIKLFDQEIALIARSKGLLEKESRLLSKKIERNNQKLQETRERLRQLKKLYAQRLVYAYKYGKVRNLQLLLSSQSINQAIIRYRYLKMIAEHDERTIATIREKQKEIEQLGQELSKTLQAKQRNIREKRRDEASYIARKQQKNNLLKKLRWTRSSYSKQLAEKEQERERLNGLITVLERQRRQRMEAGRRPAPVNFAFDDFKKARGRLPWPVKGKVISRYGKQYDPRSKTSIKNTDIEIQSTLGTPVRSVFKGIVRMITYLPGYGNTVIIDHGQGYYTVYSHLDEIYVQKEDIVQGRQTIATVGDSGSLGGAKLQFGIYGGQATYNPEKWLE